jgi:hypothetical protein
LNKVERSSSAVRSEATITAPRATDVPEFTGMLVKLIPDADGQMDEVLQRELMH